MNLIDLKNGSYRIETSAYKLDANLNDTINYMLGLGVTLDQVNEALTTMRQCGHDRANFGVNGYFIYSDRVEDINKLKVELKAISEVKQEFNHALAVHGKTPETGQVFGRLLNLYSTLDVETLLMVLNKRGA